MPLYPHGKWSYRFYPPFLFPSSDATSLGALHAFDMIRRLSRANISLEPSPDQAHQQKRDALLGEVYTRLREKMEKRENNFQRFVVNWI